MALVLLIGCSDSTGPATSIAGSWSGSVPRQTGGNVVFTATLTQTGTTLTGTGGFSGATSFPISGTVSSSGDVAFAWTVDTQVDPPRLVHFVGDVTTSARMDGTLTDWDSVPVAITFTKQ